MIGAKELEEGKERADSKVALRFVGLITCCCCCCCCCVCLVFAAQNPVTQASRGRKC